MCFPSGEIAGPPKTRTPCPLHNSVSFWLANFQILSPVPVAVTYTRKSEPGRGEKPALVLNEIFAAGGIPVREFVSGSRQSVFLGLASVSMRTDALVWHRR